MKPASSQVGGSGGVGCVVNSAETDGSLQPYSLVARRTKECAEPGIRPVNRYGVVVPAVITVVTTDVASFVIVSSYAEIALPW